MRKLNQQGFGIIAPLLVLLVIGVIGFAGFRIYDSRGNSDVTSGTSTSNDQASTENSTNIETAAKSLDDPNLDSGVDDSQLDEDLNSLL